MAKFMGAIGYAENVEVRPGDFRDVIIERDHYGDILRNSRNMVETDRSVNSDITVENSISIVADAYASEHFFAIRYAKWMGTLWEVTTVTVERPRLILRLGGVYNGPRATTP